MESETAKIEQEGPADDGMGLPAFLACLDGAIDPRALKKLARLDEDYTETSVTLNLLEGATVTRRFPPLPLSNFEPDFLQAASETTGGGRVSVEIVAPAKKPWRFLLDLPLPEPEQESAPVAAPFQQAQAGALDLSTMFARLAESQAALQATVNNLAGVVAAGQMRQESAGRNEDTELTEMVRDIRKELLHQTLATVKGENPRGRAQMREYLSDFREFASDLGGVKSDLDAAALAMGGGAAKGPEADPIEQAEKAAAAFERVAASGFGKRLLDKFLPEKKPEEVKQLPGPDVAAEVAAAYG